MREKKLHLGPKQREQNTVLESLSLDTKFDISTSDLSFQLCSMKAKTKLSWGPVLGRRCRYIKANYPYERLPGVGVQLP